MAKPHFIFDFETMGQDLQKCVLLDCSYVIFDWDVFYYEKGYTFYELEQLVRRAKFDVTHQVKNLRYVIEKESLEWWKSQEGRVRDKIQPSSEDVTPEWFLEDLGDYLEDNLGYPLKAWWSRSNAFDPVILWRLTDNLVHSGKVQKHLPHWKVRDTRTFIDAKMNFSLKNNGFVPVEDEEEWNRIFEKHNSTHDVVADILRLQTLTRIENDLPWSKIS